MMRNVRVMLINGVVFNIRINLPEPVKANLQENVLDAIKQQLSSVTIMTKYSNFKD